MEKKNEETRRKKSKKNSNTSLVKFSIFLLVSFLSSQAIQIIFWAIYYELSCGYENPYQVEKINFLWWSGCSHDICCHNHENCHQTNGYKLTLELKSNYTQIMDRGAWKDTLPRVAKSQTWLKWLGTHARTQTTQEDADQTPSGQFQDDSQSWLCIFCMPPPPSACKSSYSLTVSRVSLSLNRSLPPSPATPQEPAFKIKQTFLFLNLTSLLAFGHKPSGPCVQWQVRNLSTSMRCIWKMRASWFAGLYLSNRCVSLHACFWPWSVCWHLC